jgi:hypothetical protein
MQTNNFLSIIKWTTPLIVFKHLKLTSQRRFDVEENSNNERDFAY